MQGPQPPKQVLLSWPLTLDHVHSKDYKMECSESVLHLRARNGRYRGGAHHQLFVPQGQFLWKRWDQGLKSLHEFLK